jgi:hypothetical protein
MLNNHQELLRAHVEALYTRDAGGRLVRVNQPDGKEAPRFFLGRTAQGSEWWFRHDLTADVVQGLEAACATASQVMEKEAAPDAVAPFKAVFEHSAPIQAVWSGPAFCFPDRVAASASSVPITRGNADLLRPHLESWRADVARGQTLYAVVVGGEAVSVCASVRETGVAHEAGVETATAFRGNGYAAHAVSTWAAAVRNQDRVPIYSTSWTNIASRAVARKLGLVQFASDIHIT